jgi:anti-sigma factor RsiW
MGRVREADSRRLHAYHDGELGRLARWRFTRRLERHPELRRELRALDWLGELARDAEARVPQPDLWDRIAQRLPAEDARRSEARPKRGPSLWWMGPAGAVVAAGLVALALALGGPSGETSRRGVVRWMDGGERSVMLLEEETATIIWMLDEPPDDEASSGGSREVV